MIAFVHTLTNCGDLAVLLPLAGVFTVWIALIRQPGTLMWWLAALALCIGVTGILKIYFFACPPLSDLHSPSGHTSFSTLIYGALTLAVATTLRGWRQTTVVGMGALFIAAIGVSRIIVQAHSIPEVLLGSVIGGLALALFGAGYLRKPPSRTFLAPLLVICAVTIILMNGHELRAEEMLHRIAIYLNIAGGCRA